MPADPQDSVATDIAAWIEEMPPGVDPDVEAARQRIGRISRQFDRLLERVADQQEITVGDLQALSVLQRSGPPYERTPKQMADTLAVTSGTISVRIERLIRAGLVEPVPATDGRSRPVRLTEHGRDRWRAATAQRTADERRLFGDAVGRDRLDQLNSLLGRLLLRLEDEFGPTSRHDNRPGQ